MFARLVTFFHPNRALPFLVAYRWASLLPALLTLNAEGQSGQSISPILVFAVAFVVNFLSPLPIIGSINWSSTIHRFSAWTYSLPRACSRSAVVLTAHIISMLSAHCWQVHFSFNCGALSLSPPYIHRFTCLAITFNLCNLLMKLSW